MKNVLLYLLISLSLVCCTSQQNQRVILFNNVSFNLIDGEEVVKIDPYKNDIFNAYFNLESIQIPLFRCIKSDSYFIYVGIPFNTTVKELTECSLTQTFNLTSFEGDSTNYLYKTYSNEKEHFTTYAESFSNNLVYVLTITNSADLSDSLFNSKEISNRFKQ